MKLKVGLAMMAKMKVLLMFLLTLVINNVSGQYLYGGVQFQQPNAYPSYRQSYDNNRRYGYGPYSSYGPNSYNNINYGNSPQPNLGEVLGDVSVAILKSLGDFLMGPDAQPYPYGPPGLPPSGPNSFGVNAGVYAGTYGGSQNGRSFPGPYGSRNSHIGGSYSGFSGWPVIPWFPPLPSLSPPISTSTATSPTPSTTSVQPLTTTPIQDVPLATVVELPLLETIES